MTKGEQTRKKIVAAARPYIQSKGYEGSSFYQRLMWRLA